MRRSTPEGGKVVVSMRVGDEPNSLQLVVNQSGAAHPDPSPSSPVRQSALAPNRG